MRDGVETRRESPPPVEIGLVPGGSERFQHQVEFLLEIDRLKHVLRQTVLLDGGRRENSVEHSWHIALAAAVFTEYADTPGLDLARAVRMLLVHDLVEIDAGDTYCYDEPGKAGQRLREEAAAGRIFGMLPADQAQDFRRLWDEFEERRTPEARFAHAMDRFQAFLHNYYTRGRTWRQHGIRRAQVIERMRPLEAATPTIWAYTTALIDDAVSRGYLLP